MTHRSLLIICTTIIIVASLVCADDAYKTRVKCRRAEGTCVTSP